jgi:tetratricopeptide (TPR) repeat protein
VVLNNALESLGEHEAVLASAREQLRRMQSGGLDAVASRPLELMALREVLIPASLGDYGRGLEAIRGTDLPAALDAEGTARAFSLRTTNIIVLMGLHDVQAAASATTDAAVEGPRDRRIAIAFERQDWPAVLALIRASPWASAPVVKARSAAALARLGRVGEARAEIAPTDAACEDCLEARGLISALAGDRAGADHWFADAARRSADLPQPNEAWGRALLILGDAQGAIAQAQEARRRGPRWADPFELRGEALLKTGDFAGAAARFAEADGRAPRWGRNHLMWGQALMLSGRYAEARRHYETAAGLDLSKPDRAALNVLLTRTAQGPLHG